MTQSPSTEQLRATLREAHRQLLEIHRTMIAATRLEYERDHGRIENPYTLLSIVSNDQTFAWLRPLTTLLVEIDDLLEQEEITPFAASAVRAAAAIMFMPSEGDDNTFYYQLRAARQNAPELVTMHAHVRQALGQLPITATVDGGR